MKNFIIPMSLLLMVTASCATRVVSDENAQFSRQEADTVETAIGPLVLPAPDSTESVRNESKLVDWPTEGLPTAPEGFVVSRFADGFDNPRITYVGPNGDLFVVESNTKNSADRITIMQDQDGDGTYKFREIFIDDLNKPYGMLVLGEFFYIAHTDGVYRYAYQQGQKKLTSVGEKILDLPAGGYNNHWTRNLIANEDNTKIYVSVGSASNNGEYGMDEEIRRACILEINPDGSGEVVFASGLRNPVGMSWNPHSGELWAAVNERDKLGDKLVPDYITSVKRDGFYGWPYSYFGQIEDPRMEGQRPDLVEKAIIPDVPVGNHTASLGLAFYDDNVFPEKYRNGAFVGQHGSWNKSVLSGYKVLFVPFENGQPGPPEDFLTGFIANLEKSEVYGRPAGVAVLPDGSILVNDDTGNTLWRVKAVSKSNSTD
ncbi:sorbosone dehydrogenase family protein [Aquiflexum sp. TKW24L]|uniref:PQQ-dependent sugar dehydrogenase n=1 Tax=Aquiflexum sp. TKW24L TaxID=2942212 RepID=UPI0020BED182|nr:sorbosone dehydrogenase family protein [Aquiflexum sp. TKW24L]MCL6261013.1 sorbosone dehydrogenase family protein [Aquiflexum sp. TKW24L]